MYTFRELSFRDVGAALKRRELGLAARISHNLGSNAVNSARFQLDKAIPAIRERLKIREFAVRQGGPETLPERLGVSRAVCCATGALLQVLGLYAGIVTFGLWTTLGAYAIGALTVVIQQIVVARSAR